MDTKPLLSTVAVWRCTHDLLRALDSQLGEPTDTYVNGAQVWLRDDGPREITLEWRLHPAGRFQRPSATSTNNVFRRMVRSLHTDDDTNMLGDPLRLWGGLEVFSAYDQEVTADELRACCVELLGLEPDVVGTVDHDLIGDAWERSAGAFDIISALMTQLGR